MVANTDREKLTKITLRQEYIWLTGDYKKAILLEYFLSKQKNNNDWFNLSYDTIAKDSLLGITPANLRKHIKHLIDKGWIERNYDEALKFASTFKYKVNKEKIETDIEKILKK
jgi:predicted transcriptional regulator